MDATTLENGVVLQLTQAMLGLVSADLRGVAIEITPERLIVHFEYARDSAENRDDVEAILGDLDAMLYDTHLSEDWRIEPAVHIGGADRDWPGQAHRRVLQRKPEDA